MTQGEPVCRSLLAFEKENYPLLNQDARAAPSCTTVAWWPSYSLDASFCADALEEALGKGRPEVFNTNQGSRFTGQEFTQVLQQRGVKIGKDGKGRYADSIFLERLWRAVNYEEVYLIAYAYAGEARRELGAYFRFYNDQRPYQALGYRTPGEVFQGIMNATGEESQARESSPEPVLASLAATAGLSLNSPSTLSNQLGPPETALSTVAVVVRMKRLHPKPWPGWP